jgi:hypothetical protein
MPYLTPTQFKLLTVAPAPIVDAVMFAAPGWLEEQLESESDAIDVVLRKRYDAPFAEPSPRAVKRWLAKIVTVSVYLRRGIDPNDQQWPLIEKAAEAAKAEIKEAAEAEKGLFDLPLRADTTASGLTRTETRVYSEQSPYVFMDGQGVTGHAEDASGGGTHG